MKIFFILFLTFINKTLFINGFLHKNNINKKLYYGDIYTELKKSSFITKPYILYNSVQNNNQPKTNLNIDPKLISIFHEKKRGFLQIIRYKNILPTFLLFFSGGWIINPSLISLFSNIYFIISSINTILIMSTSMIINDLFDIEIDKINYPTRPLITGLVTKWEAVLYIVFLLSITQFLSIHFLSDNLQFIMNISIFSLLIYTPIFKRILFMKNIFCASLVSFSLFVGGISSTNKLIELNKNFDVFSISLSVIFLSSLYSELLLDIRDYEGDKTNNIITIPVFFGKENAWILASIILIYNIISNTFSLMYIRDINTGVILSFIFVPIIKDLYDIQSMRFSKESIIKAINNAYIKPYLILLLFLCSLSR